MKYQYEENINIDVYMDLSECVSKISKYTKTEIFLPFIDQIVPAITFPYKDEEQNIILIEEMYGFLGEIIYYQPKFVDLLFSKYNE